MNTQQVDIKERMSPTEFLQADDSARALEAVGGHKLAGYDLTHRLGSGGYGEVWKAIGPGGLPKAVKIMYGERTGSHAEAEFKALERMRDLRHPFLLSIERIEVVESRMIVVTELADGNLSQRFDECRTEGRAGIPRDELLGYLRDSADALDFMAEKHGLQHLDVKPDNILLQGDHAKVGDFGLAKDLNVTNVSVINGFTPTFAAPELFEGRPGRATDQYSLAIVYQYMLTGVLPFNGRTAAQLTAQHLRSQPDVSNLQPIDRPVVARALSKNMHSRFDNCRQFVDELAKRKHGRSSNKVFVQQADNGDLARTALLKTQGCINDEALTREESTPIAITAEQTTGKALRPAVFIGVGGLAGIVMQQLRNRLDEQLGIGAADYPILQIDTDREALSELKAVGDKPGLSAEQTLAIPLRSSKEYRSASGVDLSWLSRRWLFNIPRSGQVDGIRPLGRLALCDHQATVRRHITEMLREAASPHEQNSEDLMARSRRRNEGVDVFVVAATSGGTSSGSVADIGLMVKAIVKKELMQDVEVHGILLHGTGATRNVTDVQEANTVATLQELVHLSTPGLGSPRGFDTRQTTEETTPFDHSFFVHLGDGLSRRKFHREAGKVATYLYDAAATDAQADFRAWREAEIVDANSHLSVRMLGISSQDAECFQTASSEGANLCSLMLRRWCGHMGQGSGENQRQLPAELTDTRTLLDDLKLTDNTLPRQVRALLKGECGRKIGAYAEDVFKKVKAEVNFETQPRGDVLNHMAQLLGCSTSISENGPSLHRIVAELSQSLTSITKSCEVSIHDHLQKLLDTPHRLEGANAASGYVVNTLDATVTGCKALLAEIESAFTDLSTMAPSDSPIQPNDGETLDEAAHAFCRQYCVLLAYQTIHQCFIDHVLKVAQSVSSFQAKLKTLKDSLENIAADMAGPLLLTDSVPQPIIDAFDRHVRTSFPDVLSEFLKNDQTSDDLGKKLSTSAARFLIASSDQDGQAADALGDTEDFPQSAWPGFRGSGGRRRVLGLMPEGIDQSDMEKTLRETFDDCAATRAIATDRVSVICEIEGVPTEKILQRLTHSNPHVTEVASRIHTRTDVDW